MSISFKKKSFILLTFILVIASFFIDHSMWTSSKSFHTLLETIATLLALIIGIVSLIHYYSNKSEQLFLFIGAGFLGTSFLELYHTVVTSIVFDIYFPSPPESLIPWSWTASRLFLAMLFAYSYYNVVNNSNIHVNENKIYKLTFVFTLLSFLIFAFVPMPPAYYDIQYFNRPEELIPAVLFLYALIGFYKKEFWQKNDFHYWLILSLLFNFIAQVFYMTSSHYLFDTEFDLAHILKKASYIVILIGLLKSIYRLFIEVKKLNIKLLQSEQKFDLITNAALDAIVMIDHKGKINFWNKMAETMFDYSREEAIGKDINKLIIPKKYVQNFTRDFKEFTKNEKSETIGKLIEIEVKKRNRDIFSVEISLSSLKISNSWYAVGVVRDITLRKDREKEIQRKLQKFIDAQSSIVILTDGKSLKFANKTFLEFFGYRDVDHFKEYYSCICDRFIKHGNFFHLDSVKGNKSHWIESLLNLSGRARIVSMSNKNSNICAFSVSINSYEESDYILTFTDISDTILEKQELTKAATVDILTGVYNRIYFSKFIDSILEEHKKVHMQTGIIFFDVDYFKRVNDKYGHDVGDYVLSNIVSLVKKHTRDSDKIVRWGGEEFLIIVQIEKDIDLYKIAEYLRSIIEQHNFKDVGTITCSFGCSIHNIDNNISDTIKEADEKLYNAKSVGRNRVEY